MKLVKKLFKVALITGAVEYIYPGAMDMLGDSVKEVVKACWQYYKATH